MLKFICEIECNNAAFESSPSLEVARILKQLGRRLEISEADLPQEFKLSDINGNAVGYAEFDEREPSVFEKKQAGG